MPLVVKDRVKEVTQSGHSGTSAFVMNGAPNGFQTFASALADGDLTYYCCEYGTDFEVGIGTWDEGNTTLARTTILESTNSDSAVSFASGAKTVFITLPADKAVYSDNSAEGIKVNWIKTATGNQTIFEGNDNNSVALNIDSTGLTDVYLNGVKLVETTDYTISTANNRITLTSGATANDILHAVVFGNFVGQSGASVSITGGNVDGTAIGASTASTGAFTTVTASGGTFTGDVVISSTNSLGVGGAISTGYAVDITGLSGYDDVMRLTAVGTNIGARINLTSTGTGIGRINATNNSLALQTGGTSGLTLDSSQNATFAGNVAVKDTSPDNVMNIQESVLSGRGASNGNTSLTLEHATDTGIQFFSATQTQLRFGDAGSTGAGSIIYTHGDNTLKISTSETQRFSINEVGAFGFGDGVTAGTSWHSVFGAKSQWDTKGVIVATDGTMQIGHNWYYDGADNTGYKYIGSGKANRQIHHDDYISWETTDTSGSATDEITFTEKMKLTSSGDLSITSGTNAKVTINDNIGEVGAGNIALQASNSSGSALKPMGFRAEDIRFATGSDERLRVTSSGSVLVGKTTAGDNTINGVELSTGTSWFTATNDYPIGINREGGTNGNLMKFYEDADEIGLIASYGNSLHIGGGDVGIGFYQAADAVVPLTPSDGVLRDDAIDLGYSSGGKFKNLFLGGSVVIADDGEGIVFQTATGDATSRNLDDYEEGTWTPGTSSSGTISGTSITYTGKYTKIGNVVHIWFQANSDSGDIEIASYKAFTGLPFTADNTAKGTGTVVTEDFEIEARQGICNTATTTLWIGACGSSSGTNQITAQATYRV